VVSTSSEACLRSARVARDIGVDRLLGGTQVEEVLAILAGCPVRYLPFPGRPFDHPTKLAGTAAQIEDDCRRFQTLGCAGVDLLAFRATEADPLELVRAARRGTDGFLLIAGSVQRPDQIRALAAAGADAFTIGIRRVRWLVRPRMGSCDRSESSPRCLPVSCDPIARLLAGRYPDPETGEPLGVPARSVDRGLAGRREAELVAALDLGHHLAVVSGEATFAALGRRVERALASRFVVSASCSSTRLMPTRPRSRGWSPASTSGPMRWSRWARVRSTTCARWRRKN
jgi:hypothetical protein